MSSLDHATRVASILNKAGFEAYIIGGAVRDLLLGRDPKDFDLVTNATPEQLEKIDAFHGVKPVHPRQAFGVTLVTILDGKNQISFEVTTYRRDIEAHLGRKLTKVEFAHLEDDLERRDFTINALAYDPLNNYLIDEVGGLSDLESKKIRFIGNPNQRILEDPLRIMRGLRFGQQLDFSFEPSTEQALEQAIANNQLSEIAIDRLRQELNIMLKLGNRAAGLELLDSMGALAQILPELTAGKGVAQPHDMHAEGDVFTHTMIAVRYLPIDASLRLIWATLLHDIGKVPTQTMPRSKADRIHFNNHFKVGAEMAANVLSRFNFAKRFTREVSWMIEMHMGIDDLPKMTPAHQARMLSHPGFADLLKLHHADARASWQPRGSTVYKPDPKFEQLHEIYDEFLANQQKPQPKLKDIGIDGHWLSQELGIARGPQLGIALEKLETAFFEGKVKSKEDAKKLLSS